MLMCRQMLLSHEQVDSCDTSARQTILGASSHSSTAVDCWLGGALRGCAAASLHRHFYHVMYSCVNTWVSGRYGLTASKPTGRQFVSWQVVQHLLRAAVPPTR
jgi:hypothetical protein